MSGSTGQRASFDGLKTGRARGRVTGKDEAKKDYTPSASLKLKGGYTGFAVYERFNGASGFSIESLNCEVDYTVPGQPQFKETIP
jgi:uncharacterized protein with beta-barrel porin domain